MTVVAAKLKQLGYAAKTEWYRNVERWQNWYEGYDPDFHEGAWLGVTKDKNDIQISSLRMAKTVCEDWAALLLGEGTTITIKDTASDQYLQGVKDDQMQGGIFGSTNFWQRTNELVERAFALGLGAILPRIKDAQTTKDGRLTAGTIGYDFIAADKIIPLTWENRSIISCAFATDRIEDGKRYAVLQIHEPGKIKYVWYEYTKTGLRATERPEYASEITFQDNTLFLPAFVYPQASNHLEDDSPFGVSIYATAIDALRGVDLAYDNFNSDLELGRKMVFIRDELIAKNSAGEPISPHKTRRRLFVPIGDGLPADEPFIKEYNPDLRTEESTAAIQAQLNYLAFKCGLGQRYYTFHQGAVQTATQIISENSPLYRNREKHNIVVEKALIDVCRNTLRLAAEIGEPVNPWTPISISFDDSIIEDTGAEKMRFMSEIAAGIRQPWEYRVKFFGEDENKAKEMAPPAPPVSSFFGNEE